MKENLIKAQEFAEELKQSEISRHCLSECEKNQCCTNLEHFSLDIGAKQVALLYGDRLMAEHPSIARTRNGQERLLRSKIKQLVSDGILFPDGNGRFKYAGPVCPRYDRSERACEVHGNYFRPKCCEKFPISAEEDFLFMDARCGYIGQNWEGIFREAQSYGLGKSKESFPVRILCNGIPGRPFSIYNLPEDMEIVRKRLSF